MLRLLDKLLFSGLLVLALQLPQLADHYQQNLAGRYEATKWQVQGYEETAKTFGYATASAMITHHENNPVASVRADAQQKRLTLTHYQDLSEGVTLFLSGNLLEKGWYMLQPERYEILEQTLTHFKPGLPLSYEGVGFGVIAAILLNLVITLPFRVFQPRRSLKAESAE